MKQLRLIQFDGRTWQPIGDVFETAFPASRSSAPCQNIRDGIMADTKKLSVEKALNKLREADARQSKSTRRDEEIDALDEEIKRMRAQRLRLERPQRKKP